jgi:hypothetical protein
MDLIKGTKWLAAAVQAKTLLAAGLAHVELDPEPLGRGGLSVSCCGPEEKGSELLMCDRCLGVLRLGRTGHLFICSALVVFVRLLLHETPLILLLSIHIH